MLELFLGFYLEIEVGVAGEFKLLSSLFECYSVGFLWSLISPGTSWSFVSVKMFLLISSKMVIEQDGLQHHYRGV